MKNVIKLDIILTGTLQPTSILGTDALCNIASEFFTLQFTKS